MAILIEANYSKKLGLPAYSSHSYSVTIRRELQDLAQVERESSDLYRLLQSCVDHEIQQTGFIPGASNGNNNQPNVQPIEKPVQWQCSAKQRDLIERIMREHKLPQDEVDALATERFGAPMAALNKLQTSGLIDGLLESVGDKPRNRNGYRQRQFEPGGRK